jgi:uncharacterized protein YeaO (DUF488 family)
MLYTGQTHRELNKPSRHYDETWVIMRYPTRNTKITGEWHPELAPSQSLFSLFTKLQDDGKWNKIAFDTIYTPAFIRELAANKQAQASLNYLYAATQTKDIILLCSCYNETLCHRSIIQKLIEGAGAVMNNQPDPYGLYDQYHDCITQTEHT